MSRVHPHARIFWILVQLPCSRSCAKAHPDVFLLHCQLALYISSSLMALRGYGSLALVASFCAGSALTLVLIQLSQSTYRYSDVYSYYVMLPSADEGVPAYGASAHVRRSCGNSLGYRGLKWKTEDYVEVREGFLDNPSQEPGVCVYGSRIYLLGGYNTTRHDRDFDSEVIVLGTDRFTIYDMATSVAFEGPKLPFVGNHLGCAVSPSGQIHVTGGFCQNCKSGKDMAHKRHWIIDANQLNTSSTMVARWKERAHMPIAVGAHGCQFLRDGKMYCTGGGLSQWGPFSDQLSIYDPRTDSWTRGPSMITGRDHIMHVASMYDGNVLFVVGGRTNISTHFTSTTADPYFWTTAYTAEMFDLRLGEWRGVRGPTTPREATSLVPYHRRGPDKEPTILLVGDQRYLGHAGHATHTLDEFDPETGLYYCHRPLPFPLCATAAGTYNGKLHIVGGCEWIGHSATTRVMVVDLENAPEPRNCFYQEYPVFDEWSNSFHGREPFPRFSDEVFKNFRKAEVQCLFKSLLIGRGANFSKNALIRETDSEMGRSIYLKQYPDVKADFDKGIIKSVWNHYVRHGRSEGRRWYGCY